MSEKKNDMQFDGALITEQGITFAIVIVKPQVLNSYLECEKVRSGFSPVFPNVPIILMAQDSKGIPEYQGRKDIVNFLANISASQIPWERYTIT
ncbi:MAG: hypothetical protein R2813_08740 [Flavobacteriales bacterium]